MSSKINSFLKLTLVGDAAIGKVIFNLNFIHISHHIYKPIIIINQDLSYFRVNKI